MEWHQMDALELGQAIGAGIIDPLDLADYFLDRIARHDAEGAVFLKPLPERARSEAAAARARARAGTRLSPLDGVPLAWKDVYDIAGFATTNGSPLLAERIAERDAPLVERACLSGLVTLGKTGCPDFCFSGIGINPHFGTPANPFDGATARVPGGSSSGSAVALARGLAPLATGSDTGGSIRIPSSWNGLVGLKTSFGRLPGEGMTPLSPSLDTAGPMARSLADVNALFAILAGEKPVDLAGAGLAGSRLAVATNVFWDDADAGIADAAETAIDRLARAGAEIAREPFEEFNAAHALLERYGPFHSAEAYAIYGEMVERNPARVFRPIYERMRLGLAMSGADVERLRFGLHQLARSLHARMAGYDAVLAPTVAMTPPPIAALADGGPAYLAANARALRNTRLGNFLVLCALTLPCGYDAHGIPVGLMLMARPGHEEALLRTAAAVEATLETGRVTPPENR